MELEDHRNKATKELYKLIYYEGKNTKIEDVKKCVEDGAYLTGIRTTYGIPLLYAMYKLCSPDIIAYLVEKGGLDWNYKEPLRAEYYNYHSDIKLIVDIDFITYDSIMNYLIDVKYSHNNNPILDNIMLKQYKKELPRFQYKKKKPIKNYIMNEDDLLNISYLKEYCKILNVRYEDIHYKNYLSPEFVRYDHYKDYKDYFPKDDQPYCWKPTNKNTDNE
jgi:hypothetical protein